MNRSGQSNRFLTMFRNRGVTILVSIHIIAYQYLLNFQKKSWSI
ncbi:Uncharacterised protein [Streptococcus pneumoniae]|nr:Uncharacterised protein [Streptococcus pneumoniae]